MPRAAGDTWAGSSLTGNRLDEGCDPQHYGLGIKELWEVEPENFQPGLVVHGAGWPLTNEASGGFFLYHLDQNQVVVGLIIDLNYSNPWIQSV